MTEHKATPEQWAAIEGTPSACLSSALLELRSRVEALETAAKPAESTRQEMLDSSLVDRVTAVIADPDGPEELWHDDARAAILEIAAWVDRLGYHSCAAELRKEVPQPCCEPS